MFRQFKLHASLLGLAALASLAPAAAQNVAGRAYVSGTGADSGTCPRTAPCKTFAYAITQAPASGQIVVLNTADYGPVTITKTLIIAGEDGATAIIHSGANNGVTVNAGASDVVNLRGLDIENVGNNAITINSGNVNIEHCILTGSPNGIVIGSAGKTTVSHTTITGTLTYGIEDQTPGSSLVLDHVSLAGTGAFAIFAAGSSLTMTDSSIVGWNVGLFLSHGSKGFLRRTVIAGSPTCIVGISGSTLYLGTTTVTSCGFGVAAAGTFNSYSNNIIVGNSTNIAGMPTTVHTADGYSSTFK